MDGKQKKTKESSITYVICIREVKQARDTSQEPFCNERRKKYSFLFSFTLDTYLKDIDLTTCCKLYTMQVKKMHQNNQPKVNPQEKLIISPLGKSFYPPIFSFVSVLPLTKILTGTTKARMMHLSSCPVRT